MVKFRFSYILIFIVMACFSCHEQVSDPYKNLSEACFVDMADDDLMLNSHEIRRCIDTLMRADSAAFIADRSTRNYYYSHKPFIWINRNGVLSRADTALHYLRQAANCGLDTNKLRVKKIASDIRRLRKLDVSEPGNRINKLMARVEYNLTRAYLRYSAGQMYGFVNPDRLYNNLEKCDSDTVSGQVKYTHLSDLKVQRPGSSFFETAIHKAFKDSVGDFLSEVQPRNALYSALVKRLHSTSTPASERVKILCNIERCRWRQRAYRDFQNYEKYVVVNVPSYSLRAVREGHTINMRVAVGTTEHKTPLLTSSIIRMDLNPQWIIPKSIARGIVGKTGYMHSEGMFVFDKKAGHLPPESVSYTKIMNGEQYIIQAGGPKNPLGRIIFRFKNNFSVYLHDTSSPWLLRKNRRALSHGCIRVEKPFDLAIFMIDDEEKTLAKKIHYSMTMPFANDDALANRVRIDHKLLVNNVNVKPTVPIFITYYTIFYNGDNKLVPFNDIYGYDEALARELSPFIK